MKRKEWSRSSIGALSLMMLISIGLVGCGTVDVGAVEIGIEPTPMPEVLTYTNSFYGFEFEYAETWVLSEEANAVLLSRDSLTLRINVAWNGEDVGPGIFGRTGMGGWGDTLYGGKVSFMGQVIPAQVLFYDGKNKAVFYNGGSLIEVDDLIFAISLQDLGWITQEDYELLDVSDETIAEASAILASFIRIEATGSPADPEGNPLVEPTSVPADVPSGWVRFENADSSFAFFHSPEASVSEEPNLVKVELGSAQLLIAFRGVDEDVQISGDRQLVGKFFPNEDISFLGEEIATFLNVEEDKFLGLFFGGPGLEIEAGDLRFVISLLDTNGSGEFPNAEMDEMKVLVSLIELVVSE